MLYNEQIDEFVDWVSGENTFTGEDITGGLLVSGAKIRELLQTKLQNPIHVEEDPKNNVYRIFSSVKAYQLWAEDPSNNAKLQLFTIPRPSDYKLELNLTNNGDRYAKYGDNSGTSTKIQFSWRIYNDEGPSNDGITVTYTISNEDGSSHSFTRRYNSGVSEDFSIYNYLKVGENRVEISAIGNNTGARSSTSFNIIMLDLRVACGFKFAEKHVRNEALRVPYSFYRNNTEGTAKIYFIVDEGGIDNTFAVDILNGGSNLVEDSSKMISPTLTPGLHVLLIYAEAEYNSGQITVYSNLLYFTFVVESNEAGAVDKFINVATSFESGNYPFSQLTLTATQYYNTSLRWGYYTYASITDKSIPITWKLLEGLDDEEPQTLSTITADTSYEAAQLDYIPTKYTRTEQLYMRAYFGETALITIPIYIILNADLANIKETENYELKFSAYGKTNNSPNKDEWKDSTGTVTTTFTNIAWNTNQGWYNNSFRTSGTSSYAVINFKPLYNLKSSYSLEEQQLFPFKYGKTIEIEFESERVSNSADKLIVIGDPQGCRIEITPNTATLYDDNGNEVVHTNYKANERVKLAFIINKVPQTQSDIATVDDGLAYIVNNGILERGAVANGRSFKGNGNIKIGGSNSGVRVYNLRIYDKNISYADAYNNFVYDSEDKAEIVSRNKILNNSGEISYDLCKNKIDTILITGNLSDLLRQGPEKTDADVMIERICPTDSTKDFIIGDLIDDPDRPGEKIVVNGARIRKHGLSTLNYPITSMKFWLNKSKSGDTPIFSKTGLENLLLNKNRYKMKNSSIPANKFVLQANYADSSGVHNGGLLRLIQDAWYKARIDGLYKLRTLPQLFSTIKSNEKSSYGLNSVWADYFPRNEFPYQIEVAPNSFPCAVFYYDLEGSKTSTFLGQYVFMEDKKSDFNYGERSIYKVASDPFCMTVTHADDDTDSNCIWDNKDVLRIEVLEINKSYSSYQTLDGFETYNSATGKFGWERDFELIYPDPDDVAEDDNKKNLAKNNPNSKFYKKVKPFVDWYKWLISTKDNHTKFRQEAADHLDLYKLAAYYIFVLRFALVDSLERNAQIKTYDGVHFHYEPWDMDIALGNKNDGGIAFNPPVDRNTKLNTQTYAISGRAANDSGTVISSNWLWDALEAWPEWNEIVKKVADALYDAGLTYDNVCKMFDDEYANAWCEIMYNKSGHFKYVQSAGGDLTRWLGWLLGARMSHRHWWLSTSMDYYDAKWFCGDYKNHAIYIAANINADPNKHITITPNSATYMTVTVNNQDTQTEEVDSTRDVSPLSPLVYSLVDGASTKAPMHIYGANFMEHIDLSDIAIGLDGLDLTGTYSLVLGAPLKTLNIGIPVSGSGDTYTGILSPATCGVSPSQTNINAFENLESLNIRGHMHLGNVQQFSFTINLWIRDLDMSVLRDFYAMGSNLTNFYSSDSGNDFNTIELPSTVTNINMKNSTWNTLEFWDTTVGLNDFATMTKHSTAITGGGTVNIPSTVNEVHFLGSTGRTRESLMFIRDWLKSIVETEGEENLWRYTLEMDDVCWTPDVVGNVEDLLTYDELALICKMNGKDVDEEDENYLKIIPIKGYITLKYEGAGTELTVELLTQLRTWFGDAVFTKGSSGLVVDYMHNYVQINVGGDAKIIGGQIYLEEGGRAMLSATQFLLSESTDDDYIWGLASTAGSASSVSLIRGVRILSSDSTADHRTYLVSSESTQGTDYSVFVKVTADGNIYETEVHIISAKYPTNFTFDYTRNGNIEPRYNNGTVVLWLNGISCNMFITTTDTYTALIRSIVYTITAPNGRTCSYSTKTGPSWEGELFNIDERINIEECPTTLGIDDTKCVRVNCPEGIPNNSDTFTYIIQALVTFVSDKQMTTTSSFVLMDDSTPIITALQPMFYNPVATRWQAKFGETLSKNNLYRSDLYNIDGTLTFTANNEFTNLVSNKGTDSILEYLPSVNGLVFDGNSNLTSTDLRITANDHNLMIFDKMPALTSLSILNCTSLTEDIDLSVNTEITQVDASGTTVNVILPTNPKITRIEYGTPTEINIINPTVLNADNIVVDSYATLDSLELVNIPNTKTFTAFGNILDMFILGGTVIYYRVLSTDSGHKGEEVYSANDYDWVSSYIPVAKGANITINRSPAVTGGYDVFEYNNAKEYITNDYLWKSNTAPVLQLNSETKYIRFKVDRNTVYNIVDNTTGDVYFSYNPN